MSDAMMDLIPEMERKRLYPYRANCMTCNALIASNVENDKNAMCAGCHRELHRELHSLGC